MHELCDSKLNYAQFDSMSTGTSEFKPLLSQSVGYGVVVGVGFFFAGVMLILTYLQSRYTNMSPGSSEEFTSASRNVKPGLVCCGIVSAWTWSATLLQSSTAAYTFGVSGPWWYGVGGTIQLAIFGMVAAKVKMNANGAHTFLEIVQVRFGTGPHLLFTFYGFLCNLVVCGSLLLGGSATVTALTGMNTDAACMLLPIGIAVYVLVGLADQQRLSHFSTDRWYDCRGLRATFICDWSHTVILFVVIYIFVFKTYGTSQETEGVSGLYDLLQAAAITTPVEGNQNGSYLTMKSNQGLVFGAATILSGFAGIFCDQGYWQRAIASHPTSTTKAYMLGGLSWFAVPFAFASCLGLAARGLSNNPKFPTYPSPLSASQTSAGLAAPAAAAVLMGKGGAVAVLLVVFMAVTSAASAELIGVSSLFSYDVYRTYFRPNAKGPEIVKVSHYFICFWAVWMGAWAVILNKVGVDLGWLFYVQGVVLSPAVIPVALTVSWSKLTKPAVILGPILGAILGMAAWMVGCLQILGSINISNLANPYSAVCSGLTGLLFSGVITVGLSLWQPDNYDFKGTRAIADLDSIEGVVSRPRSNSSGDEKTEEGEVTGLDIANREFVLSVDGDVVDVSVLKGSFKRAAWYSLALTLIVTIVVPLAMFFSHYVYSKPFYTFWMSISIIWVLLSGVFAVLLPVWESRQEMFVIVRGCYESLHNV
ncbi:solute symporter family transporter [Lentinula aciculospora]|uniref:Solute symporter family transporter n=1 Tax=Lentinula aciculospora TaxID=153920 RepID=A0A9W9AFR6_9AGAR|nr:solute symporter family transporter [Lentinula aciculospora]